ncbi:MAG: bifunctional riboflavin kinase/FAD synthetase [Gemmatimonadaceae bacterium]
MSVHILGAPGQDELTPDVAATVVTVGTFDGVHLGHQDVLARLVDCGRRSGRPSVLVTFEPHPLEVINPEAAPLLLTTRQEKIALLSRTGLDYVVVLPFTPELAQLPATSFVDEILRERFRMSELLIGHDHGFGRGREGDITLLRALGSERGFRVDVVPPVLTADGEPVSSTAVRRALASGALDHSRALLGRHYSLRGRVVAGEARGRLLGFPTLNVDPDAPRKLLPPDGVYAVEVDGSRGRFGGMMNLGGRPTFGDERRTVEAHLFDASGDFYGEDVEVAFVALLRDTMRFPDPGALVAQLQRDAVAARAALTALGEHGNLDGSTHVPPSTP